ncbi:pentatricopeptide repeat-containing protein At5g59600 [Cryptomeria japonica]|uniref:pentatricopeptide repeat-containing protein At5g59600 n=1 Tax=Cryptomeria japonica TaxID=3369 RepID=UPI0025AC23FB|nr:pentatricopeptide repeat-containing protein At5g59600 [Cryptomeria japonica]
MVIKPFLRTKAVITSRLNKYSKRVSDNPNLKLAELCKEGWLKEALHILLTSHKLTVNSSTYLQLLQTCISNKTLSVGRHIHSHINERGIKLSGHKLLQDTLIRMYDHCGSLVDARGVFDKMTERDILSWNAIIAAYRRKGYPQEALTLFHQMQATGVQPDQFTFSSILQAYAKIRALEQGMCIHQRIIGRGFLSDVVVASALIDMYTKCGSIDTARQLFDKMSQRDVISWNAMIAGYAQNAVLDKALNLFKEVPRRDTFSWNAMIAGYAQIGDLNQALKIFKEMPRPDVVSWNALIAGYTQNGFAEKALETFNQMQYAGIKPDATTFSSVLPACAKMGALKQGVYIHQCIVENGFLLNVIVASALVDMYAKCGSIQKAHELFNKMPQKNVVSWSAIIAGYAQNGFCKAALKLFELMRQSGTYPNHVSFACVLLACSHAGLVDEGCKYFNGMSEQCITPTTDHYVCLADLLARAGYLEQTLNFIIKMPIKPVVVVWASLLGACRTHKNIQLGVFTATVLFELDPKNSAAYVLLSNIYAEVGRWGEVTDRTHRHMRFMQCWTNCLGRLRRQGAFQIQRRN